MFDAGPLIKALASVAHEWADPEFGPREAAVEKTMEASNSFTEEALAFAVNQQMSLLTEPNLTGWLSGRSAREQLPVGVLNAGNVPFVEMQDFLAVVLTGHRYLGTVSSKSPVLFRSFVDEVRLREPSLKATILSADDLFRSSDAIIATGSNETMDWVSEKCLAEGIAGENRLLRGNGFAAAVLDGGETEDDYEHLAEDALLHEGLGCRNVAVIWAPSGLSPDPLLQALAHFRGVFPAHAGTPGRLKMQRAFLEAVGSPHAHGEGLEFLLSKGAPDVQVPGHIRWTEYETLEEIQEWVEGNRERLQLVAARNAVAERLFLPVEVISLGTAQRPDLSWCPGGVDTIDFLCRIRPSFNRPRETS